MRMWFYISALAIALAMIFLVIFINDANTFGEEWQGREYEAKMFHEVDGAQPPLKKCEIKKSLAL